MPFAHNYPLTSSFCCFFFFGAILLWKNSTMAMEVSHTLKRYNLRPRRAHKRVGLCAPRCLRQCKRHNLRPRTNDQKKQRGSSIPYLSPEIIFNIFIYLPADILYNVVRYVCQEWYKIISSPTFIDAHLQKVDRGILIRQSYPEYYIHYVEMVKRDLEVIELDSSALPIYSMSSCNGLVLMGKSEKENRYVANLVTKEVVNIPPPSAAAKANICFSAMGYTCSKKYKLVEFYYSHQWTLEIGILTLGVDKEWRCLCQLDGTWKFEKFRGTDLIFKKPIVSTDGILHWPHDQLPLVLNLDLETETFYICAAPQCSEMKRRRYLGTGQSLCFMDYLGKFSWELWLLKDAETGEWTKLANIDLGHHKQMLRRSLCPGGFQIVPVGWLEDGEIVIFYVVHEDRIPNERCYHHKIHPTRNCITYNVKTGVIKSFHLEKGRVFQMNETWRYIPHAKTLVSPKFSVS